MKILIIHPSFHIYGGAELALVKLIDYFKRKGHTVDLATCSTAPEVKADLKTDNILYARNMQELKTVVNSNYLNYHVIHPHNHPAELMLDVPYPSVWFCNEPSEEALSGKKLSKNEVDFVNNNITEIAVSDQFNKDRFERIYGRADANIIPYGVDYQFFGKGKANRWLFKTEDSFVVAHVGWFHPRKNQMESLRVLNEIKDDIPNLKFLFIGKFTPYVNEMLKYIDENNLKNYVILEEFVDRGQLRDLYKSVDVILHPIKAQGGWLVPLEAMSAGLPVIVSEGAVFSEYFRDNKLGIVTSEYSKTIKDIYKNRKRYKKLVKISNKFIVENLSWDNYASKVEKLLKKAVK